MGRLIPWPEGVRISGMSPLSGPRTIGAASSESLAGYVQTVAGVFGLWRWQLRLAPMKGAAFQRYRGTIAALHGGANALRVPFYNPDASGFANVDAWSQPRVALFMRFDGADGATVAYDESPSRHVATFAGNAQLDTAQKAFGVSSLLCDGTTDYVTIPNHADFRVAAGRDFALKCRARFAAISGFHQLVGLWNTASNRRSWALFAINNGTDAINVLRFSYSLDGTTVVNTVQSAPAAITTGVWYDIRVTRAAGVIRLYLDGVEVATATDNSAFYVNTADPLHIGGSTAGASSTNGHIDQVEIIQNIATNIAAFTPPTVVERLSYDVPRVDGEVWRHAADMFPDGGGVVGATRMKMFSFNGGHQLGIGDWFGFAPYHFGVYMVTEVLAPGDYRIWPPLRKAVVDGYATRRPVMAMRLESEVAASIDRGVDWADGPTMTLVEVMDPDVATYFNDGGA